MKANAQIVNRRGRGFTLLELLIVVSLIAVLATLTVGSWKFYRGVATRAVCSDNLRQLGAAVNLYTADNAGFFPPYEQKTSQGTMWYFGLEGSSGGGEGDRNLDTTQGPLYPYIEEVGTIVLCPAFDYGNPLWKAKYTGASYGYGYNWLLGGTTSGKPLNVTQVSNSAQVMLFGDCGQVNTFQAPASASNPMMEEFYILDSTDKTIHFRHNSHANILFVDGHVQSYSPYPGTEDTRVPGELFGRITPVGTQMLK